MDKTRKLILLSLICGLVVTFLLETKPDRFKLSYESEYKLLHYMRVITSSIGLEKYNFIKKMYDKNCLIDNPIYSEKEMSTECFCENEIKSLTITKPKKFMKLYKTSTNSKTMKPFVVLNHLHDNITFKSIRKMYQKYKNSFELGHNHVLSLSNWELFSQDLNGIFEKEEPPTNSVYEWNFNYIEASSIVRKLLPRPKFIPETFEIGLGKSLIFFGTGIENEIFHKINVPSEDNVYYVQVTGTSKIRLKTKDHCSCDETVIIEKLLDPGNLVHFNGLKYTAEIAKSNNQYTIGLISFVRNV